MFLCLGLFNRKKGKLPTDLNKSPRSSPEPLRKLTDPLRDPGKIAASLGLPAPELRKRRTNSDVTPIIKDRSVSCL